MLHSPQFHLCLQPCPTKFSCHIQIWIENSLVHCLKLRRHGIPVWYSRTNILGAQQWHDEIGAALHRCDWFVLVLSPHAVESIWVKRELLFSLQQNRFEDKIIPLLYQSCAYERLSWTLSLSQMVDFTQTFEQGEQENSSSS